VKLFCYSTEEEAFEAERHFIKWEDPKFNIDRSSPKSLDIEPQPIYWVSGDI
jgi:hypothetical protein